ATLATLADTLDLGVDSFRDAAAEGSGPLRSVRIDRLDGATVQRDGPATAAVVRMLGAQQGIFRPAVEYVSDVGDGSALVLTFPDTTT
ncbi:MAG: hypothetical protein IE926_18150, partial [Micrococcales bacterium]|nr:hypothetical protein [Micrococcales bacterium]